MNTSLETALLDVVRAAREQSGLTTEEIQERLMGLKEYLREAGGCLNKAIAHSVRELRKRRGLTQKQFARGLNEHPDLTNESYRQFLTEIRRAEAGLGIGMVMLMYIGLRFAGPNYTSGTLGSIDDAQAFVAKIFQDGRAGGIGRMMTNCEDKSMDEIPETIEGVNLVRLYRLTIDPSTTSGYMRVAFIEADNPNQAREVVTHIVALLDLLTVRQAATLVRNVRTAGELIGNGYSDDVLHRLFEVQGAMAYEHPIFLLSNPGTLTKKWAERVANRKLA
jgi:hypothetical protein